MSTLQEALVDAGVARPTHAPESGIAVRGKRLAHSAPPDAPASLIGRVQPEHKYLGRRWDMGRFTTDRISLGPKEPRVRKPDDSARVIREMSRKAAAQQMPAFLASIPMHLLEQIVVDDGTCPRCHMKLPVACDTCPDC